MLRNEYKAQTHTKIQKKERKEKRNIPNPQNKKILNPLKDNKPKQKTQKSLMKKNSKIKQNLAVV